MKTKGWRDYSTHFENKNQFPDFRSYKSKGLKIVTSPRESGDNSALGSSIIEFLPKPQYVIPTENKEFEMYKLMLKEKVK